MGGFLRLLATLGIAFRQRALGHGLGPARGKKRGDRKRKDRKRKVRKRKLCQWGIGIVLYPLRQDHISVWFLTCKYSLLTLVCWKYLDFALMSLFGVVCLSSFSLISYISHSKDTLTI